MTGIAGWLAVYLIGSLLLTAFYAAGLSGWVFDYPIALFVGIFAVLAAPLVLVPLRTATAPAWNIAALWIGTGLISLRILTGALQADKERLTSSAVTTLVTITLVAIIWATVWTAYFLRSDRVANTFG